MKKTMKALVKAKAETGIWLQEVPVPECDENSVLIKVYKSSICGTDVHIYKYDDWARKTIPIPMVVGHEFCGYIEKIGKNVKNFKPGDYVAGEGHITCGMCRNCFAGRRHLCAHTLGLGVNRPGSFAEYLVLPEANVYKLPANLDPNIAAILDPMGNAVHTALSFDMIGEDVLITGAGPIGMMAIKISKMVGARHVVVTDVNDYRLDLAKKAGACRTVNINRESLQEVMQELGMKEGFDIGLEMSGSPAALQSMVQHMIHGGKIAILGIPPKGEVAIDWNEVIFKMLTIKGIYGREIYETWYKMTALIQSGMDMSFIITHNLPIDDFQQGFDAMLSGKAGKVILNW